MESYFTTEHTGRTDQVGVSDQTGTPTVTLEWREAPYFGPEGVKSLRVSGYADAETAKGAAKALADRLRKAPKATFSLALNPRQWDDKTKAKSEWVITEIRRWADEQAEAGLTVQVS